jgi:hypothetical protein
MGSLSKVLCIAVLAIMPACLGDDPNLDQPEDTGGITATKVNPPLTAPTENPHVLPPPPKTRIQQTATEATQTPDIDTVGDGQDPLNLNDDLSVVTHEKDWQP